MTGLIYGVLGLTGIAVVIVLGIATTKPAAFRIERRKVMPAPPDAVFPNLDDLRRWAAWSPWEKLDPNLQRTYGGAERGVGATYAWRGNDKAGEGKMTITESRPNEHLALSLEFIKPFPATNTATFTVNATPTGTEVTWAMAGRNTFMGKVFSVFADMDSMIGKDFEKGLESLARVSSERGAPVGA